MYPEDCTSMLVVENNRGLKSDKSDSVPFLTGLTVHK